MVAEGMTFKIELEIAVDEANEFYIGIVLNAEFINDLT
jgi:hypothetical protein